MKVCRHCGTENSDEMNFCTECGASLVSSGESFSGPQTTKNPQAQITRAFSYDPTVTPKPKSKSLHVLIGGIIVLILLFVSVGALVAYFAVKRVLELSNTNIQTNTDTANTEAENPSVSNKNTPVSNVSPSRSSSPYTQPSNTNPVASFTPPLSPTKVGTFTVYASGGWQLSDIDVVENEEFSTSVEGLIDLAGIKNNVTYAGVNDEKTKSRRIYPEYPTGALLMRTRYADGKVSNVQAVYLSRYWKNFPDEIGKLEFCVNDNSPDNNGGQFIVTVKMISAPSQKRSSDTTSPKSQGTTKLPPKESSDDYAGDISY